MTKKAVMKWVDAKKHVALMAVADQETEAIHRLKDWKYEQTKVEELAAELAPKINDVYACIRDWHMKYKDILGEAPNRYYGSTLWALESLAGPAEDLLKRLQTRDFNETPKDRQVKEHFRKIYDNTAAAYDAIKRNCSSLPNAKQCIEYLNSLGFDFVEPDEEDTVCTALMTPVDTRYLFLKAKEDDQ